MSDRRLSPVATLAFERNSLSEKLITQDLVSPERSSDSFWLDMTYILGTKPLFMPLRAQPLQHVWFSDTEHYKKPPQTSNSRADVAQGQRPISLQCPGWQTNKWCGWFLSTLWTSTTVQNAFGFFPVLWFLTNKASVNSYVEFYGKK